VNLEVTSQIAIAILGGGAIWLVGRLEHMRKQTPPKVKAAIIRCGPNYKYRTLYDGTLQVNRGRGWERLRYE